MIEQVSRKHRFTLVEIMVVIAVIAILMSVGLYLLGGTTTQASEAKTKAFMGMIENAIAQYKNTMGHLPMSPLTADAHYGTQYTPFYMDNYDEDSTEENDNKNIKYNMVQFFDIEQIKNNLQYDPAADRKFVIDGFGMPFLYMAPGYRTGSYDLVSLGANQMPGHGDGVPKGLKGTRIGDGKISITDKKEKEYAVQLGEGDDIANFTAL